MGAGACRIAIARKSRGGGNIPAIDGRVAGADSSGTRTPMVLEIVTPEGRREIRDAASVTLQAADGELTVLRGHAPLLALLAAGRLTVVTREGRRRFVTGAGNARIGPQRVSLLLFDLCAEEDIGRDAAMARLEAAEKALAVHESAAPPELREEHLCELRYAEAMLALLDERR
jgi:F-type H+-transporting ATPase subunit epsilon